MMDTGGLISLSFYLYVFHICDTFTGNMAKRNIKRTCSRCNGPLEKNRYGRYRYCRKCHAEYMRLTRPKFSELTDEQKMRALARSLAKIALKRGKIEKQPCNECGAFDSQMHHEDYTKPLQVDWKCRRCHLKHHGYNPK